VQYACFGIFEKAPLGHEKMDFLCLHLTMRKQAPCVKL